MRTSLEGAPTDGLADFVGPADHTEADGSGPPFPLELGPFFVMGPAPWRGISPTISNVDNNTDMSDAGPLEPIEVDDGLATSSAAPLATGRATANALSLLIINAGVQVDSTSELSNTSGLSYLATGGSAGLLSAPSAAAVDDWLAGDEGSTEPVLPVAITAGGVSLNILLGGADVPVQNEPGGLEQVAELVPLSESSLALAATLWSIPSDSPTSAPRWDLAPGKAADPDARKVAASAWALFVTGIDQALEQTCRDIQGGILSSEGRQGENEGHEGESDELLEWQGPILPAAQGGLPDTVPKSRPTGRSTTFNDAGQGTLQTRQDSQPTSDDSPPVMLGVMPTVSVVSVSSLIAAWFWRQYRRLRPRSLGGIRSTSR